MIFPLLILLSMALPCSLIQDFRAVSPHPVIEIQFEGDPVTIDTILFYGDVPFDSAFLPRLAIAFQDSTIDSTLVKHLRTTLKQRLGLYGYLFSEILISIDEDTLHNRADLLVDIKQGPLVISGDLTLTGNSKTKDIVLKRELTFGPGDLLTSQKLYESTARLYGTRLFDAVSIEPEDTLTFDTTGSAVLPVMIQVQEADPTAWKLSAGYNDFNKYFITAAILHRNLFGLAHSFETGITGSFVDSDLILTYGWPYFLNLPLSTNISSSILFSNEYAYSAFFFTSSMAIRAKLKEFYIPQFRIRLEHPISYDIKDSLSELSLKRGTRAFGAAILRDTRRTFTKERFADFILFQGDLAGFGNNVNHFYLLRSDLRIFLKLLPGKLSFSSGLYSGIIDGYNNYQVPPQELFRPGRHGFQIVRGYQENELFDSQEITPSLGGKMVIQLTAAELTLRIYRFIGGAVFLDGGKIWEEPENLNLRDFLWGAGPGLRITTPAGVIKVDYGFPLDRSFSLKRGNIHLNIGFPAR